MYDPESETQECVECGRLEEWNFAIRDAAGHVVWVCQEHGQDGLEGDEPI